jgi:hypothetical protein
MNLVRLARVGPTRGGEAAMANMTFTFLPGVAGGGLMLLAHTSRPPNDAEWDPYIDELVKHDPKQLRSLAFTDGGAPSGAQRKQVNDFLKGQASRAAVITASTMVRGVVTALSWFNSQMKVYPPDELEAALQHLGVRPDEVPQVRREIQLLRKKLGYADLKCIVSD